MLRRTFPYGEFGAAASEGQIAAAELTLGIRFPDQLRALYLECDGFREDRGNAKYLLSLIDEDHIGSLRTVTEFCWTEFKETWPELDLTPYVFFGLSCADEFWGIRCDGSDEIIAFHHHMEGAYEVVGRSILAVYEADYSRYPSEA